MSDENTTNPEVEVTQPVVETPAVETPVEEGKPVGAATIVEMETPAEQFPTQGDETTTEQQ